MSAAVDAVQLLELIEPVPDVAVSALERERSPAVTSAATLVAGVEVWLPGALVKSNVASAPVNGVQLVFVLPESTFCVPES